MYSRVFNITFDCSDPRSLAAFWGQVTGLEIRQAYDEPGREEYAVGPSPDGGPRMYFVGVPERKVAKNRVHLDLIPPDHGQAVELKRLVGLGARVLDSQPPDVGWVVLADPEGNEFCLES
jgi:hypothetical protein